jgi:RimK-like ATP-grasp domain
VILVAGIPDERPMAALIDALDAIGAEYRVFDQRQAAACAMTWEIADAAGGGRIDGTLTLAGERIPLARIDGMYVRMMEAALLPGMDEAGKGERGHCLRLHEMLSQFADIVPGRVLNRPGDMGSNHSKPYQAQVIRDAGFDIPETLITNDPTAARAFIEQAWADGRGVIYKSVSGVRSIVQRVGEADLDRLDRIRWCPTQFQWQVCGTDIRVHVVGQTAIGASISSDATDYRYASRQTGATPVIAAADLGAAVGARCVRLSQRLNLPLAGIDLRRTPDGRYVCFEVNPSPAFTFYERPGGSIAMCIARYLVRDAD